jgi:hypothetical protein
MRLVPTLLFCLVAGGCSFSGDITPLEEYPPPNDKLLAGGILAGIKDSHFDPPIEVTDVYRAPANSTPQWMVCVRSAKSEDARRLTYSVFFGKTGYVNSRYSASNENCASQAYHPHN